MSSSQIDAYLENVPEPQRGTLQALRRLIHSILPKADECITYGIPTFQIQGRSIAGFAAYKNHCSYFPMSGSTLTTLKDDVANYETSKGTLRFAADRCLPADLVKKLIKTRLQEEAGKENAKG